MTVSIKRHFSHASTQEEIEFKRIMNTVLADLAAQKVIMDELVDDHATYRTEVVAIGTTLANFKTIYDGHTHLADGNAATVSLPDTNSPTGSPGAVSAFTDTSGSSVPAALTSSATALTLVE